MTTALLLASCTPPSSQPQNGGISGTASLAGGVNLTSVAPTSQAATPQAARPLTQASVDWNAPHVAGQLLIVSPTGAQVATIKSVRGLAVETLKAGISRVQVPDGTDEKALAEQISADTGYIVQPNYVYRALAADVSPNDPYFSSPPASSPNGDAQWYLTQIDAPGAWAVQTAGALVAVLDTGAELLHEDLRGRAQAGYNFCPAFGASGCNTQAPNTDVSDINSTDASSGHGTHTAGIIGANTNNSLGIAGVTWSGNMLIVKVLGAGSDSGGAFIATDTTALAAGIQYAANNNAKVINMSLGVPVGGPGFNDPAVVNQINYAHDTKGAVLVAAAGNYQPGTASRPVYFPANNAKVIAVGAVDRNNNVADISAIGSEIDVWAPGKGENFTAGKGILSTDLNGNYRWRYGTSESAPQVAGVASLIRARNPSLTPTQVEEIIRKTARPISGQTAGLLQAGAAVRQATAATTTPPPTNQQGRTVYVYADRQVNGTFDGNDLNSGRAVVAMPAGARSVEFTINETRNGKPLPSGTYRIVACINENSNGQACDSGDIGGSGPTVVYTGAPVTGADVVMTPQ